MNDIQEVKNIAQRNREDINEMKPKVNKLSDYMNYQKGIHAGKLDVKSENGMKPLVKQAMVLLGTALTIIATLVAVIGGQQ